MNDVKMWVLGTPKFKAGDVYFVRGRSIISVLIRLVISIRYGIPYNDTYSHTEVQVDETSHVSAEPNGVMVVENDNSSIMHASRVEVYRIKMNSLKIKKLVSTAMSFVGKGYAYARYLLDSWRIGMFYLSIVAVSKLIIGKWNGWVLVGVAIGFVAVEKVLKYYDIRTMDCAEVVAASFDAAGVMPVLGKARDDHPSGIRKSVKTLEWNGKAELIAWRTNKSGGWMIKNPNSVVKK